MSEDAWEVQSQVEQLESRLARARSELESIGKQSERSGRGASFALAVIACTVFLMAAAPPPKKVKAPFLVVDSGGKKVFEVVEAGVDRGFALYNQNEQRVVIGAAGLTASFFKAISPDKNMQAAFGVVDNGKTPTFTLRYGGDNASRVAIAVVEGKASIEMKNDKNVMVAQAGVGASGGGYVLLLDGKSTPSVLFGVTAKNAGKVITYPNAGAGGAMVGLKGTMICGLAGCQ
jgi:hypothetical protein